MNSAVTRYVLPSSLGHTIRASVWISLVLLLGTGLVAHAGGLIPGTYSLSSGTELDLKKDSAINGIPISKGTTGTDSVVLLDGTRSTVSQTLPSLDPPTFPANASTTKATEAGSPFTSSTAIFFKKITVAKNQSATFTGGGPFHIDTLDVKKDATLNLAAGTYFIDTLKIDKNTVLHVTSTPVILHIGDKADVKKDVVMNPGGTVPGFVSSCMPMRNSRGTRIWSSPGSSMAPPPKRSISRRTRCSTAPSSPGGELK